MVKILRSFLIIPKKLRYKNLISVDKQKKPPSGIIISEGIGGIMFSKNIAKQIVRYAIVEFFSTAKLI